MGERLIHFPAELLERHALGGAQPVQQQALPSAPQARLAAIGQAIERVVVDSYSGAHAMRHRTTAEDLRRASICVRWFNDLLNRHRWTPDRALSAMRYVLDDELNGRVHPVISRKTAGMEMWAPDKSLVC